MWSYILWPKVLYNDGQNIDPRSFHRPETGDGPGRYINECFCRVVVAELLTGETAKHGQKQQSRAGIGWPLTWPDRGTYHATGWDWMGFTKYLIFPGNCAFIVSSQCFPLGHHDLLSLLSACLDTPQSWEKEKKGKKERPVSQPRSRLFRSGWQKLWPPDYFGELLSKRFGSITAAKVVVAKIVVAKTAVANIVVAKIVVAKIFLDKICHAKIFLAKPVMPPDYYTYHNKTMSTSIIKTVTTPIPPNLRHLDYLK